MNEFVCCFSQCSIGQHQTNTQNTNMNHLFHGKILLIKSRLEKYLGALSCMVNVYTSQKTVSYPPKFC